MARKIMVQQEYGSGPVLMTEALADNEAQLQEIMKENPDLLPVDEFGMTGPLMVVGQETTLPSGAIDLLSVTRGGELLLIEFKGSTPFNRGEQSSSMSSLQQPPRSSPAPLG